MSTIEPNRDTLTQEEQHILTHALVGGRSEVIRNEWAAFPSDEGISSLLARGLLVAGDLVSPPPQRTFCPGLRRYYVTEAGAKAVGLELPSSAVLGAYAARMAELDRQHRKRP